MSLEDDVRRDMERGNRWERRHGWYLALLSALAIAAWCAFDAYREYVIWTR